MSDRNRFLDHSSSGESDVDDGYDSEAADISKGERLTTAGRSTKRRKLSHTGSDDETSDSGGERGHSGLRAPDDTESGEDGGEDDAVGREHVYPTKDEIDDRQLATTKPSEFGVDRPASTQTHTLINSTPTARSLEQAKSKKKKRDKKPMTPGVVYLSSLPPYLKPSALRNLLSQRGFEPITRLFLTPASKHKHGSKKNSRQLYSEGWIEFASKKTARACAETLNASIVGGKKGGFYHDDLWNMKYLSGMGWSELMAGIREERREEEGRRDEERRTIERETKRFIEGVERGRTEEGMKRKRSGKGKAGTGEQKGDIKRTWRQFEVKGMGTNDVDSNGSRKERKDKINTEVQDVLGQIF